MAIYRRHLRNEYRWCLKDLSTAGQFLRPVAESEILDNPFDTEHTVPGFWGGRAVSVHDTQQLITIYHMLNGQTVSFDLVFDSLDPPDWLLYADESWFKDLDLSE